MGRHSIGWKNLWSLTVLVFLRLKPMHPYELRSVIKLTHKDDFLQLNAGSIYNSIERLLKAGLIEIVETGRAGRRPERTIYTITRNGEEELVKWLRELLRTPSSDPIPFYAALSFLPALEPSDALDQLTDRTEQLEAEIQKYREVLRTVGAQIGRLHLIEVEYALALRTAERRWVIQIIDDLRSEKLSWNPQQLQKVSAQLFTGAMPSTTRKNKSKEAK
jgi:DNA-binding PadR family transcriptional regulator